MPVEQVEKDLFTSESRRVDAEFRRLDAETAGVKKSQEKFETKTEKAINDLRIDVSALRTEMNTRFDKMRNDMNAGFEKINEKFEKTNEKIDRNYKAADEKIDRNYEALNEKIDRNYKAIDEKMNGNFKAMVTIYLTTTGIVLAAFYAFASYMAK
ncbi:MAG: hypothetical protein LBL51_04035 [Synergistaceae bacterium]|jgi:hypothetical protein|nr:hypothetical protein [Synergistaceae bacterium]